MAIRETELNTALTSEANTQATPDNRDIADRGASEPSFTISELAEEFSITARAIRFYESRKLISPRRVGASRVYSKRDRARLQIILRGKNLGFSLEDIGEYLSLYDTDPTQQAQTEMLLGRVEESIVNLEKKRSDIDRTLEELRGLQQRSLDHMRSNVNKS